MESITEIYRLPMATDEDQHHGQLNGNVLGQMLLAQSRFLEALERRDRVAAASDDHANPGDSAGIR